MFFFHRSYNFRITLFIWVLALPAISLPPDSLFSFSIFSAGPLCTGVHDEKIPKFLEALAWWQRRLRLLVLVSAGYVDRISIRRWFYAQCTTPMGRWVQHHGFHLGMAMFSMLFTGEYKQCELLLAVSPPVADVRFVQPMCQCGLKPQLKQGVSVLTRAHGDVRQLPAWKGSFKDPANGLLRHHAGLGNWSLQQVTTHWIRQPGLQYLGKPAPLEGPYKPQGPWLPGEGNAVQRRSSKLIRVPWWVSESMLCKADLRLSKDPSFTYLHSDLGPIHGGPSS